MGKWVKSEEMGTTLAEDRNNALLPAKTKPNSGVASQATPFEELIVSDYQYTISN